MKVEIAVAAALCAAFCFALGSLIQQDAARQAHSRTLRFGLLVALVHERRWLAGMTITVLSFGIQAVALAFGPLALVQPLVATEVREFQPRHPFLQHPLLAILFFSNLFRRSRCGMFAPSSL